MLYLDTKYMETLSTPHIPSLIRSMAVLDQYTGGP